MVLGDVEKSIYTQRGGLITTNAANADTRRTEKIERMNVTE